MRSLFRPVLPALLLVVLVAGGCDVLRRDELGEVPSEAEAAEFYARHADVSAVDVKGNVIELHVRQPGDQLRRGGSLWARVGPYVYLLSPATRGLFEAYPAVAAVRVVTSTDRDREVARAMLRRDALGPSQWRHAEALLGHALQPGTEQPRMLERLAEWGERYAEYDYNPEFVPTR